MPASGFTHARNRVRTFAPSSLARFLELAATRACAPPAPHALLHCLDLSRERAVLPSSLPPFWSPPAGRRPQRRQSPQEAVRANPGGHPANAGGAQDSRTAKG